MTKLLYITPHLSTGGLPKFLLKKIEHLVDVFDIYLIEWANISNAYTVQKEQIRKILKSDHFFTLGENKKEEVLKIIEQINPDIIHLEEIPEMFMDFETSKLIYLWPNRMFKIFETTHSSDFNVSEKLFFPDKFLFVCQFSKIQYSRFDIESKVIEFPINKKQLDKKLFKQELGLDPNFYHVVVVGLFTPRKNQKYAFEIARKLINYRIQFHFIGNQAPNFEFYWKPLMENKPSNCIIWGEKNNVEDFLAASDLSLFPSEGNIGDKELNPLVIKESIELNTPLLLYNLDVYLGKYNNSPEINFLTGDINNDANTILKILKIDNQQNEKREKEKISQYNFDFKFNSNDQKIYIQNLSSDSFTFSYIVIREIDSCVPIYYCQDMNIWGHCQVWIAPINNYNFDNDEHCGGFTIDFYNSNKEILYSYSLPIKPNRKSKHIIHNIDPFDCEYINYREFFDIGVYEGVDFDDLDLVIDVGSNVGLFTEYILAKGAKKIIGVEPITKAFNSYKKLFLNKENVIGINAAIDITSGEKEMFFSEENTTISRFENNFEHYNYDYKTEKVKTITWAELLKQNNIGPENRISLVKMDIEGYEYTIFDNLSNEEIKQVNGFIIEFHRNENNEIKKIINKLKQNQFKIALRKQSALEEIDENAREGIIVAQRDIPEEVFVSFATQKYEEIVLLLIKSILEFSSRSIILFTVNFDLNFSHPKLYKQRLNIDIGAPEFINKSEIKVEDKLITLPNDSLGCVNRSNISSFNLLNLKPLIMLKALELGIKRAVFIDADSLVKENIDTIFNKFDFEIDYPLAGKGIHDHMILNGRGNVWNGDDPIETPLMKQLGVKDRSTTYVSTNLILFTQKTKKFLQTWKDFTITPEISQNIEYYLPFQDETLFNVLLWKTKAIKHLPVSFFGLIDYECGLRFYQESKTDVFTDSRWQYIPPDKNTVVFFHGCKSITELNKMFLRIKENNSNKIEIIKTSPFYCFANPNYKSNFAIVTLFDQNYSNLAKLSIPNFKKYTQKQKYDLIYYNETIDSTLPPQWQKVKAILNHLESYSWVWWLDVDSLIMNFNIRLENIIDDNFDLIFTKNKFSYISNGSAFYKNSTVTKEFLEKVWNRTDTLLKDINVKVFDHEQQAMRVLLQKDVRFLNKVKFIHERVCNSYHSTTNLNVLKYYPEWNNEDNLYQPGDFVIQFAGQEKERRIELMEKFCNKTNYLNFKL